MIQFKYEKRFVRPSPQEIHGWYCKSRQEPMTRELTGPRDKPTTIILLNRPSIKLPSELTSLNP